MLTYSTIAHPVYWPMYGCGGNPVSKASRCDSSGMRSDDLLQLVTCPRGHVGDKGTR